MHACAYIPTQLMNTQERASIAHTFTLGSFTYNCNDHAFPVQRQCLSLLLSRIKFTQTDFLRGVSLTWLSSSKTVNLKGPSPGPIANVNYTLEVVRRRSGTVLPQYCSLKKFGSSLEQMHDTELACNKTARGRASLLTLTLQKPPQAEFLPCLFPCTAESRDRPMVAWRAPPPIKQNSFSFGSLFGD